MSADEHDPMAVLDMLERLQMAKQAVEAAERGLAAARHDRDEVIREALNQNLPRTMIAKTAGIHEQRLYQIRHGRR